MYAKGTSAEHALITLFTSQGEPGKKGPPGLIGPKGIPVSQQINLLTGHDKGLTFSKQSKICYILYRLAIQTKADLSQNYWLKLCFSYLIMVYKCAAFVEDNF